MFSPSGRLLHNPLITPWLRNLQLQGALLLDRRAPLFHLGMFTDPDHGALKAEERMLTRQC